MAGLTENGLVIRTQPEILAMLEERLEAAFPGANVRAGPLHALLVVYSEELALAWKTLGELDASFSPASASAALLDQIASLTNTRRRPPTRSRVVAAVNLDPSVMLAAGAIAAVRGQPDAQFRSVSAVANSGDAPADVPAIFEALTTGPIPAPVGELTVIVTPRAGWNSITNPAAAALGLERMTDDELREQRLIELATPGRRTRRSIQAAVARVDGVQSVAVIENASISPDSEGRPGKSFEVVVWDGAVPAADDSAIAQAIWDRRPETATTHGATIGTATDEDGASREVRFTRATQLPVYVSVEVVLRDAPAGWEDAVRAAVVERASRYEVGTTAYASQFLCEVLRVPGIVAVASLTLGTVSPGSDASVVPTYAQAVRVELDDVTVTQAP